MRLTRICGACILLVVASCVVEEQDSNSNSAGNGATTTAGVGGNTAASATSASISASSGAGGMSNGAGESGKMVGFTAAHNAVRNALGIADLSWSEDVAKVAQAYAEKLAAEDCAFYHSMGDYGENLYWSKGFEPTAADVTDAWASEVKDYDYASNSCVPGKMCGHYTQIVWADTKTLGCGRAVCGDGAEVWVCNYDPPGNFIGKRPY